jgi:hypothetical protein
MHSKENSYLQPKTMPYSLDEDAKTLKASKANG